ncbi:MAG: hypothetical protein HY299_05535 [Verrucomicrobia bacterium]|nr:hypothetical protein [Verrucomicrobiota bacterium]
MKNSTLLFSAALTMLSVVGSAHAVNITIPDGLGANGIGKGFEDQETEPATLNRQDWDMEAFTLNGKTLSVYGGFNLLSGNPTQSPKYNLGDIFVDVNGDAAYKAPYPDTGLNSTTTDDKFHYDYIISFDAHGARNSTTGIGTGAYTVYKVLNEKGTVLDQTEFVGRANPWRLNVKLSGANVTAVATGTLVQTSNPSGTVTLEDGTKITGGSAAMPHYKGDVDLSGFLTTHDLENGKTLFHLTQECGNDILVGQVADGGSTLALLGSAITGLSLVLRRSRKA